MSDLDNVDVHEVATLLHVHEKLLGHPKLKAIRDWVEAKLEGHAKALEPEVEAEEAPIDGSVEGVSNEPDHDPEPDHDEDQPIERKI